MKSLSPRAHQRITATKALLLVAVVWGIAYPSLLWGFKHLLPA